VRLTDLEPSFRKLVRLRDGRSGTREVKRISEAQGVMFLCPACFVTNRGRVGTHMVLCWSRSRGVPDSEKPGPGRWTLDGTGLHDLTLNGDPPGNARSVKLMSGCAWHGHITNGEVA
jgi:hypothetical protein